MLNPEQFVQDRLPLAVNDQETLEFTGIAYDVGSSGY